MVFRECDFERDECHVEFGIVESACCDFAQLALGADAKAAGFEDGDADCRLICADRNRAYPVV